MKLIWSFSSKIENGEF